MGKEERRAHKEDVLMYFHTKNRNFFSVTSNSFTIFLHNFRYTADGDLKNQRG
jgi:hypothetical protein